MLTTSGDVQSTKKFHKISIFEIKGPRHPRFSNQTFAVFELSKNFLQFVKAKFRRIRIR